MDEFFQKLREIQKKERNVSGLADVGDNFYKDVHSYLNKLIMRIGNNPFSFDSYLLRDARRIAAEIGERREHKIINNALLNIQKSYELFNEKSEKQGSSSPAMPPSNLTPEEEKLYFSIVQSLSEYRKKMNSSLKPYKRINEETIGLEIESNRPSLKTDNEELKSKGKRPVPLGIEQDIESYQAYEQPEFEIGNPQNSTDVEDVMEDPKNQIKTLMVLEELPSIMGVDKEIYGPFYPQDIITMPEQNAKILIKNNKGRFIKKYRKIAYK